MSEAEWAALQDMQAEGWDAPQEHQSCMYGCGVSKWHSGCVEVGAVSTVCCCVLRCIVDPFDSIVCPSRSMSRLHCMQNFRSYRSHDMFCVSEISNDKDIIDIKLLSNNNSSAILLLLWMMM